MDLSILVPVCNEVDNVHELYLRIAKALQALGGPAEILFVDDGSTDGTFAVLELLHRRDPRVRVLQLRRNYGKAGAYAVGFRAARGPIIVTMDGDLQDDPDELPKFLRALAEGADVVTGWKVQGKGPWHRALPSRVFNWVLRRLTGLPFHDFNCPFKAYRREVAQELDLYGELYRYILVLVHRLGHRIAEVPIANYPRRAGVSKYGTGRLVHAFLDLLTVLFLTRFSARPLHVLGGVSLALLGLGGAVALGLTAAHFVGYVWLGLPEWEIRTRPLLLLGVLLILAGLQVLSIGLVAELLVRGRPEAREAYAVRRRLP
ncbi:MAG: glycosyltransferase family 2 protein [Deltaproteobacteria bacterium]|nr:glycosyltransferase family 2 protein [Deltaproteobacteria bacterium]